jgi:hypothetical protein
MSVSAEEVLAAWAAWAQQENAESGTVQAVKLAPSQIFAQMYPGLYKGHVRRARLLGKVIMNRNKREVQKHFANMMPIYQMDPTGVIPYPILYFRERTPEEIAANTPRTPSPAVWYYYGKEMHEPYVPPYYREGEGKDIPYTPSTYPSNEQETQEYSQPQPVSPMGQPR